MEGGIIDGIPFLLPPPARNAEHNGAAIRFEKFDEGAAFFQSVVSAIVKPDSPHCDEWLTFMMEISGIITHFHFFAKHFPIFRDGFHLIFAQTGKVIHNRISSPIAVGSLASV